VLEGERDSLRELAESLQIEKEQLAIEFQRQLEDERAQTDQRVAELLGKHADGRSSENNDEQERDDVQTLERINAEQRDTIEMLQENNAIA
jgi:hypothetical protein